MGDSIATRVRSAARPAQRGDAEGIDDDVRSLSIQEPADQAPGADPADTTSWLRVRRDARIETCKRSTWIRKVMQLRQSGSVPTPGVAG